MEFLEPNEIINKSGLRLVIVRGTPSPWSQAAKAMMEYKGLDYSIGGHEIGGENPEYVAWSHQNSGPIVAWEQEPPRSHWLSILELLERLGSHKPLLPADPADRAKVLGISNEICGELGIGWNLRLQLFKPIMDSGEPPAMMQQMGAKYRYNDADVAKANDRLVQSFNFLSSVLDEQIGKGKKYFVGDEVTAADFYWAAFCNIAVFPEEEWIPISPEWRGLFGPLAPAVDEALTSSLRNHRDHMMQTYFQIPMVM